VSPKQVYKSLLRMTLLSRDMCVRARARAHARGAGEVRLY